MNTPDKHIDKFVDRLVEHAAGRPVWEVMRADEAEAGNTVIVPGEVPWLPVADWEHTIVISRRGKEIRLIILLAKRRGNGAFHRLVNGILGDGLTPVILAPMGAMRAIMKRWNWFERSVGSGWDHEEQWRPRKGWRA
jgi:hypothetical protein